MNERKIEHFRSGDRIYHGIFVENAALDITRHSYATTDPDDDVQGFLEVLEFPNIRGQRPKVVIYRETHEGDEIECVAFHFRRVEDAINAMPNAWRTCKLTKRYSTQWSFCC